MKSTAFKILRMLKSRKGISPILATLLLIVIAVAAISVTYAWIMTYMGNTTDKAGVMLYQANVNYVATGTPKNITVDIGNSGTSSAQIVSVYAGTSSSSMQLCTLTSNLTYAAGFSQSIAPSGITSFNVTVSSAGWSSGQMYYFKVVPSSGTPLTFNEKAP